MVHAGLCNSMIARGVCEVCKGTKQQRALHSPAAQATRQEHSGPADTIPTTCPQRARTQASKQTGKPASQPASKPARARLDALRRELRNVVLLQLLLGGVRVHRFKVLRGIRAARHQDAVRAAGVIIEELGAVKHLALVREPHGVFLLVLVEHVHCDVLLALVKLRRVLCGLLVRDCGLGARGGGLCSARLLLAPAKVAKLAR